MIFVCIRSNTVTLNKVWTLTNSCDSNHHNQLESSDNCPKWRGLLTVWIIEAGHVAGKP